MSSHRDALGIEQRATRRDIHVGHLGPDVFPNGSVLASADSSLLAAAARILIAVAQQRTNEEGAP